MLDENYSSFKFMEQCVNLPGYYLLPYDTIMLRTKCGSKVNIKMANKTSTNVAKFKYLQVTLRFQSECIKKLSKLNSGNAYHLVQNVVFPFTVYEHKNKIYRTIILSATVC
jgi:hypothetical protein